MADLNQIISVHEEFIARARELNGTTWKEVYSEVHSQFKEIPVWVLLYDDSPLEKAHEDFNRLMSSYLIRIDDYNFTVAYQMYQSDTLITLDFLGSNEEIIRGWGVSPPLGSNPSRRKKKSELFKSQNSNREP